MVYYYTVPPHIYQRPEKQVKDLFIDTPENSNVINSLGKSISLVIAFFLSVLET